jgi:hypothetical protein
LFGGLANQDESTLFAYENIRREMMGAKSWATIQAGLLTVAIIPFLLWGIYVR